MSLVKITLKVSGMNCQHCKQAVEEALLELDEQAQVIVDLDSGLVQVQTSANSQDVSAALEESGYAAVVL